MGNELNQNPELQNKRVDPAVSGSSTEPVQESQIKTAPIDPKDEYTDGRKPWEWESKFPPTARVEIRREAKLLVAGLVACIVLSGSFLALGDQFLELPVAFTATPLTFSVSAKLLALFFTGCVGGITFSIKWLVHAAATGKWHQDRRYWRLLIPWLGGVYALALLALASGGYVGAQTSDPVKLASASPALAFLIGYFSDGVSGLLSNIANAVFGTLEKK